jgi:amino acid adenylation domain-containing protein
VCVLQLFERNVCAFPDALAIACEGRQLTYRELNSTAEQIAHGLREAGVAGGCLVGVLLDRSPEMVAALLGIWKAGGVYLPVDPATPAQRIAFMLEDAEASFVLTRRKWVGSIPGTLPLDRRLLDRRLLILDDLCRRGSPSCSAPSTVSAQGLAYVIYTSGSTGKPKGAAITHGGLANTIRGVGDDLNLAPEDVVLAWSTIAFDVACLEIYLPLAFGASLYLAASDDGLRMEQIRRSAATVMFGTPTMYRLLLEEGWQGDARMQAVVGGEVLSLGLGSSLAGTCRAVWNQYGPTETAICATRSKIDADAKRITIGYPLPNVSVHLLDQHLQPVPRGSMGEVYIGGAGVGLGYLKRRDLSRERFLSDPFSGGGQARLFRSGDLAIELADGSFDFMGRVDDQVKIRGYRIELGEIEFALRQCEGVQAAAVRALEWEAGDRRLVAFVVGDVTFLAQWKDQWKDLWKRRLRSRLPDYMVPSEFVPLRSFPTTPGGKVDVQALDAMRLSAAPSLPGSEEWPADPMEARLKVIWESLLKVRMIGLHDDFFALGGRSLLAARMLVQVEKWFGSKLPHSVLVEHPTIHGLAKYLRQCPAGKWPALATIQAGGLLPPLFVAHGIGGSLLSFIDLAAELGPEQPVYGLQLPAFIYQHQAELRALAANYVKQLRAIQPSGPYHLAGHSSGGLVVFEMACQLMEQGETVGLLALLDCDPNKGKLMHRPRYSWDSLKASLRRVRAEVKAPEFGFKDLFERRITQVRVRTRTWMAARSRRAERTRGRLLRSDGYLVLAFKDYKLRSYPGNATLFLAQDEPGSDAERVGPWAATILGGYETRLLPGTHRTILTRPQVTTLAQEIRQRLARSVEEGVAVVTA